MVATPLASPCEGRGTIVRWWRGSNKTNKDHPKWMVFLYANVILNEVKNLSRGLRNLCRGGSPRPPARA